jgi:hypothetical protein
MSSDLPARPRGVRRPIVAGAVALGLVGLVPVRAQEPRPPAQQAARPAGAPSQPQVARSSARRLRAQQLATRKAKAAYEIARLNREVAEIAVIEYQEGIFAQDLATIEGEIKLAESDLARARDRVEWARRMHKKGFLDLTAKVSEELALKKATFALEQAQSKKKVLIQYTLWKTIKELESEVAKAQADELAKKAAWEREKAKEVELGRWI